MPYNTGYNPFLQRSVMGRMEYPPSDYASAAYTVLAAISAAGDKFGCVMQAPFTGSITAVDFLTGTVTTGATMDVRIETLDASGDPSGSLLAANNNGSCVVADVDDNVIKSATLTAAASVTKGQMLGIVVVNPAGTPGNFAVRGLVGGDAKVLPYGERSITGVYTKNVAPMAIGLNYGGTYYPQFGTAIVTGSAPVGSNYNNGGAFREVGNRFTVPCAMRVSGAYYVQTNASNVDCDVVLYEGTTAVLTRTMTGVQRRAAGKHYMDFNGTYTCKPGVVYRIVVKTLSASNISYTTNSVGSNAQLAALTGTTSTYMTVKDNLGNWNDTNTSLVSCGVLFDAHLL